MNHVLLPEGGPEVENKYRYANLANPELLRRMIASGARRKQIVARVFGGASINISRTDATGRIGPRNVEMTLAFLRAEKVSLAGQSTGGERGRKVIFDLAGGQVLVKEL